MALSAAYFHTTKNANLSMMYNVLCGAGKPRPQIKLKFACVEHSLTLQDDIQAQNFRKRP